MNATQEKILDVFKRFKTAKNGILHRQSIDIHGWDKPSQDEFPNAMQELINDGYLHTNGKAYFLTEKGYDLIYRDYSVEDTKNLILGIFKERKIGIGQALLSNHFISVRNDTDRYHLDNFGNALGNLISQGFLELNDKGHYKLTKKGYDKIY